jgi:hypothetical protein
MTHPILKALADFEGVPAQRRFAARQPWMASDLLLSGIPGFSFLDRVRLAASERQSLASAADAIQLKNDMTRLRAFYLGNNPRCVKIVSNRHSIADRTREELDLRRRLEGYGTITLPAVRDVREDRDFIYITEDLVKGRRFSLRRDGDMFVEQGLPQLLETYQKHGIALEPLREHFPADMKISAPPVFLKEMEKAFADNPAIPVSICHGDLLPSNLCVSGDKLYFFDWEKSFRGPVIADLLRLPMKYPARSAKMAKSILARLEKDFAAGLGHSFTVCVAARIAQNPAKSGAFLDFWEKCRPL